MVSRAQPAISPSLHLAMRMPRRKTFSISRDTLISAALAPGVTAVIVPAGSGKTHLAVELAHAAKSQGRPTSWITATAIDHPSDLLAFIPRHNDGMIIIDGLDGSHVPEWRAVLAACTERDASFFLTGRSMLVADIAPPNACLIEPSELLFSEGEAIAFLKRRLSLKSAQIAEAVQLADGWPLCLELMSGALQRTTDETIASQLCEPGRIGAEFLDNACFATIDSQRMKILRLLAEAGDAQEIVDLVASEEGKPTVLSLLADSLLFTGKSEEAEPRMRPLVRETLCRRPVPADEVEAHYGRIGRLLVRVDRPLQGLPHLLKAGYAEQAHRSAEQSLFRLLMSGCVDEAMAVLHQMPAEAVLASDGLRLGAAWTLATAGGLRVGTLIPKGLEILTSASTPLDRDHATVIQMLLAAHADDPDWAAAAISRVEKPGSLSPAFAATFANTERWVARQRGEIIKISHEAAELIDKGDPPYILHSLGASAFRDAEWMLNAGEPVRAIEFIAPLLGFVQRVLGRRSCSAARLTAILSYAHVEAGDLLAARSTLRGHQQDILRLVPPDAAWFGLVAEARIELGEGRWAGAMAVLDQIEAHGRAHDLHRMIALALLERARMAFTFGRPDCLSDLPDRLRMLVHEQSCDRPIMLRHVRLITSLAFAYHDILLGDPESIRTHLADAETLAEALCVSTYSREITCLRETRNTANRSPCPVTSERDTSIAVAMAGRGGSPLSAREVTILLHMAGGLSNKGIARELGLSQETVKWYVKRIFAKIDAKDRFHALERARLSGLLPFAFAEM